MNEQHKVLITGVILGGLGVAIGAFGAHALKSLLMANNRIDTFELAVRYQFYHALALLLIGALYQKFESQKLNWAAFCMAVGVLIFSGSLYLLALTNITTLGIVTPFGGAFMIGGWVLFLLSIVEKSKVS